MSIEQGFNSEGGGSEKSHEEVDSAVAKAVEALDMKRREIDMNRREIRRKWETADDETKEELKKSLELLAKEFKQVEVRRKTLLGEEPNQ